MTDIPAFTGGGGLSTLILRQVETKKTAFVMVRAFEKATLNQHLACCKGFCRSVGAEAVYASADGQRLLPDREPTYTMPRLRREVSALDGSAPKSVALSPDNAQSYVDIYNACFSDILGSRTFTIKDAKTAIADLETDGRLYLSGGDFAAMTQVKYDGSSATLQAIAVLPKFRGGFGSAVLAEVINKAGKKNCETLFVEVMSTNLPALKMYEKMGFTPEKELSAWYLLD